MGVHDHPVHDKVRQSADFKYGCHSDRTDLRFKKPHRMSMLCRSFYLWDEDQACAGCTQPRDTAYAEEMKGLV